MTLSKFLESWNPKKGENHLINYQSLISDATDETLTHYYIKDINDNPSAVVESTELRQSLQSIPYDIQSSHTFFSDRVYINYEQNNFTKQIRLNTFYLDEMNDGELFDEFITSKKGKPLLKFEPCNSQKLVLFLLKNDSLLVYSSRKVKPGTAESDESNDSGSENSDELMDSSSDKIEHSSINRTESTNSNGAEAFISLRLFEYKHYEENEQINITIGKNTLSQIIPDSLTENTFNSSLFDYRYENNEEIINAIISDNIFNQIVLDPLSSNRFFFLAYERLYLAEIIGNGQKRHLQISKIHCDKRILKYDVSETKICYLTKNKDKFYVFESFDRSDDIVPKKIHTLDERLFSSKPYSFFLFHNSVFIKPHNCSPCIWNINKNKITDTDERILFYLPISKDWVGAVINVNDEEKIFIRSDTDKINCDTKYSDDIRLVANSSYLLIIDKYGIKQIELTPEKVKPTKSLNTFNDILNSIQRVIKSQNEKLNESIAKSNQESDDFINRIKTITENLSNNK